MLQCNWLQNTENNLLIQVDSQWYWIVYVLLRLGYYNLRPLGNIWFITVNVTVLHCNWHQNTENNLSIQVESQWYGIVSV